MTSANALKELHLMLEDLPSQDAIYQPTPFWKKASHAIVEELEEHGFEEFRSASSPQSFFVPTYGSPGNSLSSAVVKDLEASLLKHVESDSKPHRTVMQQITGESWAHADYRTYLAGDRLDQPPILSSVTESAVGRPAEQFTFEGRNFSRSFLNYLLGLVFLKQQVATESIRTVIEIGGGFGTLGEILHQAGNYAYIDVDIPPTSAVSTYYLASVGKQDVGKYSATRGLEEIAPPDPGASLILCPWQLPKLSGKVDLAVNFISFQEMEPHIVENYLREFDRLNATYVLLRNLREGKATIAEGAAYGVESPTLARDYDRFLPNYELLATNVHPFGYETVDGFHSELRLYKRR